MARSVVFIIYLMARLISIAGAAATTLVVPVIVYTATNSAAITGLVAGIGGVSYFAFGIPVGHIVDRWPRGPVLVICNLFRGLVLATIPLAILLDGFSLPLLVTGLVATNVLFVATDAANAGALWTIVGVKQLQRANALVSGSAALVEIAAPLAAGIALGRISAEDVFFVEAFAMVGSAFLLWSIRGRLDPATREPREKLTWPAVFSGFVFVWKTRLVTQTTAAALFFALSEGLILGQLIVLISVRYGPEQGASVVAQVYTAIALGSVLGSWVLTKVQFARNSAFICSAAFLLAAICLVGVVLATSQLTLIVFMGVWAVPFVVVFVGAASLRQSLAEDRLQGRVAIAGRLLTLGIGIPIGDGIGGLVSELVSVNLAYMVAVALSVSASVVFAVLHVRILARERFVNE
ncbi:MFS transporter [Rathayibacter tritici]|nr:MFS transporter [Rathayibacter tritici]